MRQTTKACILFFVSVLLILSMPAITKADEPLGWYDAPNISYPAYGVECGTGGLYIDKHVWFCWLNYSQKVMDHSFMNFSSMDAYYNPGDGFTGGGTYTLSAFQDQDTTNKAGPGLLSSFIALIQSFF